MYLRFISLLPISLSMKEDYMKDYFVERMERKYFREDKVAPLKNLSFEQLVILGIDLQNQFLLPESRAYLPSSPQFLSRLLNFYEEMKKTGVKIILTRHTHRDNILSVWWGNDMVDEHLTSLHKDVIKYGDSVVEKHTYDAFLHTPLESMLREWNIKAVIITGMMTHLCCETTARSAFNHGFSVIFPVDGTLTQNPAFHECSLRALSHGFALVPSLRRLIEWMLSLK